LRKRYAAAVALTLAAAAPSHADPTIGFGITFAFGGGPVETGLGLRVFSDDEEESAVASLGLDYMFGTGRVRPTVGIAYLDKDYYLGLDVGLNMNGGGFDLGVSAGGVDTKSEPSRRTGSDSGGEDEGDGGLIDPEDET
jgi:hypothetical protein